MKKSEESYSAENAIKVPKKLVKLLSSDFDIIGLVEEWRAIAGYKLTEKYKELINTRQHYSVAKKFMERRKDFADSVCSTMSIEFIYHISDNSNDYMKVHVSQYQDHYCSEPISIDVKINKNKKKYHWLLQWNQWEEVKN